MEIFKLPIQYVSHREVYPHILKDLELVQSEETPVYDKLFKPTTTESRQIAHQWAKYYTTDTEFLKESQALFQQVNKPIPIDPFVKHWNDIQDNKEFKISYQYIESDRLSMLNQSASFLTFISIYFITSPILFLLTPLIMLIIPFAILRMKSIDLSWSSYLDILKTVLKHHAIGGLVAGFKEADVKQRAYLVGTALLFCVQLYTNIYTFYTFYKNIATVHTVFDEAKRYLSHTIDSMNQVQKNILQHSLSKHQPFCAALEIHRERLCQLKSDVEGLNTSMFRCGTARALFYKLYDNEELKTTLRYSFGFHGFVQNVYQLNRQWKKKLNPCVFEDRTSFVRAYYPTKHPVKNTYSLDQNKVLTGPNASGKTTLLKTTLINVLLSQQIGCGFYKSATICPYDAFYCYINIPDTSGRDSLFQAEARRCKEILNEVVKKERILCIFDELFSGTNPVEAVASASSLLTFLSEYPSFRFLLTTHFFELCENVKTNPTMEMIHMKTENGKNTYKLGQGVSYDRGGVKILEQLDYPTSIVKDARMRTKEGIYNL
jgi:energy-coupling factor transporter ATP-binding protein EcfA2